MTSLSLTCIVDGDPTPNVSWLLQPSTSDSAVVPANADGSLLLRNLNKASSGLYVCQASNLWGTVTRNTQLVITGEYTVGKVFGARPCWSFTHHFHTSLSVITSFPSLQIHAEYVAASNPLLLTCWPDTSLYYSCKGSHCYRLYVPEVRSDTADLEWGMWCSVAVRLAQDFLRTAFLFGC